MGTQARIREVKNLTKPRNSEITSITKERNKEEKNDILLKAARLGCEAASKMCAAVGCELDDHQWEEILIRGAR